MRKLNKLPILLACVLLLLTMVGGIAFAGNNDSVVPSPDAGGVVVAVSIDPESELVYNGKQQTIAKVTVMWSKSATVTCDGAEVALDPSSSDTEKHWEIKATNAGEYTISVNAADEADHTEKAKETVTIAPKTATITAAGASKVYGDSNPTLTAKVEGVVNGEKLVYTLATDAKEKSPVGKYDITVGVKPDDNKNYSITTTAGTLQVNAKPGASITPDAVKLIYGESVPELTATVAGIVKGDKLDYKVVCVDKNGKEVTGILSVGKYTLKVVLGENANYDKITCQKSELVVSPRPVTVTVDKIADRFYGDENNEFTVTYSYTGDKTKPAQVEGDPIKIEFDCKADETSEVGTYDVELVVTENPNYTITTVPGKMTILPKPGASITPDAVKLIYGESVPELTATVAGIVKGDKLDYKVVCVDKNGKEVTGILSVGKYTLKVVLGENANYDKITCQESELVVSPRPVTVTVDKIADRFYGDENNEFTVTYSYTGDKTKPAQVEGDPIKIEFDCKADETSEVGTYDVELVVTENPNYTITTVPGKMTILPKPGASITPDAVKLIYGESVPELTATVAGIVKGDKLDYKVVCVDKNGKEVTGILSVGKYTLKVVLGENANYDKITCQESELVVSPRPVTVTVDKIADRFYGDENNEFTVTYSYTGDKTKPAQVEGDPIKIEFDCKADETSEVGTYDVKLVVTENPNYTVTPVDGTMEIVKRPIKIEIPDALTYLYHEDKLQKEHDYKNSVAVKWNGEGAAAAEVNGDIIQYAVYSVVDPKDNLDAETNGVSTNGVINVGTYDWYIVVDENAGKNANYDITVSHDKEHPAKLNVEYLEFDALDFDMNPAEDSNGWYNAENPATITAPKGYTISTERYEGYTDKVEFLDQGEDENGAPIGEAEYYLEDSNTGAWTDKIVAPTKYKQDTVIPEVLLTAKASDSTLAVNAHDVGAVVSGLKVAELQRYEQNEWKAFRALRSLSTTQNGVVNHRETIKVTGEIRLVVEDIAGNKVDATDTVILSTNLFVRDSDGDGLNDAFEHLAGTAWSADFDGDGLSDYLEEMTGFSNRLEVDTDGDGIQDGVEHQLGLRGSRVDSDNDGIKDPDYLRYLSALNLNTLDIELGMMLLQSNLTRANNQMVVPAADLVLLKDSTFQMDNGQNAGASYGTLPSGMGKVDQLQRYSKNFYMLRLDERDGKVVYLTTSQAGTFHLVMADMAGSRLKITNAYELPYDNNTANMAVATSADGTVVVLAPWADGATTENLLLINLNSGEQFRFGGVADTVGATRFTLSNDGSVLAYVGADKLLHTISMTTEEYVDVAYDGNALHFMADGQLVTNVDEASANGVYHVAQPTLKGVSLVLASEGKLTSLEINGRFFFSNYYLRCSVEGLRESDGIRLYALYSKMSSAK